MTQQTAPLTAVGAGWRARLYEQYATHHSGIGHHGDAVGLAFRRYVLPHLPASRSAAVLDLGCGQGGLVAQCHAHGYRNAAGVDVSAEQVAIAQARGVRNVSRGEALAALNAAAHGRGLDAVLATDLVEHLDKDEVLALFDAVFAALRPGGVLVVRTPNAVSPLSGYVQNGDFTHVTAFTARSIRQVSSVTGFSSVQVFPCRPPAHTFVSAVRRGLWSTVAGVYKFALAVETGSTDHVVTMNMVVVARR